MLADKQNGLRKHRLCDDHIFTMNSVIRNNKSVYTSFIDLKKCFDFLDRKFLLYKLLFHNMQSVHLNQNIYVTSFAYVRFKAADLQNILKKHYLQIFQNISSNINN